jgi:diadenosine tetraphosphate (Ap4A) HIT family hydrolase
VNLPDCAECQVVAGTKTPTGGLVHETPHFVVHALMAPSPLAGWVVIGSKRHARWWWELTPEESAALGPLATKVFAAQRSALGAVHAYALAIGDVLHHFHLHLVPRFEGTPRDLWGRAAFDAKPERALPDEEIARAAQALARELAR